MIGALVYLQLTTLKNAVQQRVRRLRHPRYAIAAVVGLAYFYFFFFRHVLFPHGSRPSSLPSVEVLSPELAPIGAFVVLVVVLLAWILPGSRAALRFSEAEIAFLFPAPLSRRALIHYKLIRSQLAILLSALFLSVLSRRGAMMGGSWWMHALGWWLITSLINLHLLGASFTRERLLGLGLKPWPRRLLAVAALGVIGWFTLRWLGRQLPSMADFDPGDPRALLSAVGAVLAAPPLGWLLWPFRLAVAPLFATSVGQLLQALGPMLLLLTAHYFWVIHSAVSFEEASVSLAERQAATRAALRAGRGLSFSRSQRRREPFRLPPAGSSTAAFLWKGMIGAGPRYYPLPWLVFTAAAVAATLWIALRPDYRPVAKTVTLAATILASYALLIGPVFFRRASHRMLEGMDVFKAYPLRGWQIVLGELSHPTAMLTALEFTFVAIAAVGFSVARPAAEITPAVAWAGAFGWWLVVAPLSGLLFAINFAIVLLFPAWAGAGSTSSSNQGIEMMGQRLILFAGYLFVLVVALVPATIVGAVAFVPLLLLAGLPLAIVAGAVLAAAVLTGELAVAIWWLGARYERFDLSAELPR